VEASSKEKETHNTQAVVKSPTLELKEILKPPTSFSFENEIQKIKIPVPFLELIKNEEFVGPWLWKYARIKEEKGECELRGRHSDCCQVEVNKGEEKMEQRLRKKVIG
jgi:hypothetical protein